MEKSKNKLFLTTTSLVTHRSNLILALSAAFLLSACESASDMITGVTSDGNSSYSNTGRRTPELNNRRPANMQKDANAANAKKKIITPYDQFDSSGNEIPQEESNSEGGLFSGMFKSSNTSAAAVDSAKPASSNVQRKSFPPAKTGSLKVPSPIPVPSEKNIALGSKAPLTTKTEHNVEIAPSASSPQASEEAYEAFASEESLTPSTPTLPAPLLTSVKAEPEPTYIIKAPTPVAALSASTNPPVAAASRVNAKEAVREMIQEAVEQAATEQEVAAKPEIADTTESSKPAFEHLSIVEARNDAPKADESSQIISPTNDEKLLGSVGSDSKLSIKVPNQNIDKPYPEISSVPATPKEFAIIKEDKEKNLKALELDHKIAQQDRLVLESEVTGSPAPTFTPPQDISSDTPSFNEIVKTPIAKTEDVAAAPEEPVIVPDYVDTSSNLNDNSRSVALERTEELNVNLPLIPSLQEVQIDGSSQDNDEEQKTQDGFIPASQLLNSQSILPSPDQIKELRPSRYEVRRKQSDTNQN